MSHRSFTQDFKKRKTLQSCQQEFHQKHTQSFGKGYLVYIRRHFIPQKHTQNQTQTWLKRILGGEFVG